ncbi:FREM2 [Bugula neritina]|uniref:FREM2 n=1 Tax=Bugula neritina TaxID=10212 RepID=A0A7J7JRN5_BUGNE|nr:FREM2 [Bugula neritina]
MTYFLYYTYIILYYIIYFIATYSFADVSGTLFLHSVKIQTNGHLVVEFQTQPNFYGQFIMEEKVAQSSVTSHDHLQLTFQLQLIQSENTFDNPKQTWQFVSDSAVSYVLLSCAVSHVL